MLKFVIRQNPVTCSFRTSFGDAINLNSDFCTARDLRRREMHTEEVTSAKNNQLHNYSRKEFVFIESQNTRLSLRFLFIKCNFLTIVGLIHKKAFCKLAEQKMF